MKIRSTSRPASGEERRSAADAQSGAQLKQATAASMPDARASSLAQLQQQELASNSSRTAQLKARADMMAGRGADAPVQRVEDEELLQGKFAPVQRVEDEELLQGKFAPVQRMEDDELLQGKIAAQREERPNNTGMPDQLKSGVESLSGMSMDHVKVHYNSHKPAQLNAHAYAQGSEIHMAPGQEQHLPHEAWHVVQQMQGRVQPTTAVGGMQVNDNSGLESEATSMGNKALQRKVDDGVRPWSAPNSSLALSSGSTEAIQRQLIGTIDVYEEAGYPIWTQDGVDWHMTMKDIGRWHITKSDRSMSYWFVVDAGTVTSTKPTKKEFGGHKEKHGSLDEAPAAVKNFIVGNISAIIAVTDKKPK